MKLVIISGRSGSGKTTALQALEDLGYFCIDNLPVALLPTLAEQVLKEPMEDKSGIAISIDARNTSRGLKKFPAIIGSLEQTPIQYDIIYLDAAEPTLLKRFSESRRRHPLSDGEKGLKEAIALEKQLLEPMADLAHLTIDTTRLTLYELRDQIKCRVAGRVGQQIALLFQSFGFKQGVPLDADLVYDVRCLPNPHWDPHLRKFTGQEAPVIQYLEAQPVVADMRGDIITFLERWLPEFERNNRSYLTVCIGCTGGHHRSVYLAESLASHFRQSMDNVLVKHRELSTAE